MRSFPEARPFLPIDLPLVRRLTPHGISFDSGTSLTRGIHTIEGAVWGSVPLADLGTPTFVLRNGDQSYVAQFRHKAGEQHAHIVFIAPDLEKCDGERAWLHLLDAMVAAAGRRGAVTLNAEVAETTASFLVLRQSGFGVYARQEIWKREPALVAPVAGNLLRSETEHDAFGINGLHANVVPRLVLQADAPETGRGGFIYERDGRILAYLAIQEGKYGAYIQSVVHPDAYDQAQLIIGAALNRIPRAERLPVYFCMRRYQDWLRGSLSLLGFEGWASQAVMVKHTAYRIEQAVFKPAHALEGVAHVLPPGSTKLMIERQPPRW
jgi:hypothetical protein